jgi:hypothetical protein
MKGLGGKLLAALLAVVGCASDDPQRQTAGQAFCAGYCRLVGRCSISSSPCEGECISERAGLSALSVDGAKGLGDCIAGLDCSTLSDDSIWKAQVQSCWDTASTQVPPTEHLRAFCATFAEAWFECGSWFSTEDCEQSYGMWSDATLDRFSDCAGRTSCDDFEACVQGVADS